MKTFLQNPPEPRVMLFSEDAPQGRQFSADRADELLADEDSGWQDTPLADVDMSGAVGSDVKQIADPLGEAQAGTEGETTPPEPDELAVALEAFLTIEKDPSKDQMQALADVMWDEEDQRRGLNKTDMGKALDHELGEALQTIGGGMRPWSFEDLANGVRGNADDGKDDGSGE